MRKTPCLFIGWIFAYMSFAIPVKRLRETRTLMAFHHPKPAYPFHILIVPKRVIPELDAADSTFLTDLFSTVQSLVEEFQDLLVVRLEVIPLRVHGIAVLMLRITFSSHAFSLGLEIPKKEYGRERTPRPYSFFGETSNGTVRRFQFRLISDAGEDNGPNGINL